MPVLRQSFENWPLDTSVASRAHNGLRSLLPPFASHFAESEPGEIPELDVQGN